MCNFDSAHTYRGEEVADERSTTIDIGGMEYKMVLTTKATKAIAKRYGSLENLGEKLMKTENFEIALDEIIWLITLLANQSILIHNLRNKNAIMASMLKGTKRNVESEVSKNEVVG